MRSDVEGVGDGAYILIFASPKPLLPNTLSSLIASSPVKTRKKKKISPVFLLDPLLLSLTPHTDAPKNARDEEDEILRAVQRQEQTERRLDGARSRQRQPAAPTIYTRASSTMQEQYGARGENGRSQI